MRSTSHLLRLGLAVLAFGSVWIFPADGNAEDEAIREALEHEVIGPQQSLEDVRAFVEARIPRMPELSTVESWAEEARRLRADVLEKVVLRGEAKHWDEAKAQVEWLDTIDGGPGYRIRKLRYEALPGLWIPALLYEPTKVEGKVPVVLNVNGHDPGGTAADYKQIRCINLAKRGMLALNVEWFGMGQLRTDGFQHGLINAIDLCGSGGIATHYLYMKRAIDLLLEHPNADPNRVGVTGLSGGGWQTIFISPLDERITLSNPAAGYSSFLTRTRYGSDLGDSEQTPCDLATVVDYTHLTAMLAPRPTLLTFNQKDNCCFAAPHALPPLAGATAPVFSLYQREANLRFHVNVEPGDHNYGIDNRQAFYRMLADHWSTDGDSFPREEILSDEEIKSAEELAVPLPDSNLDFQQLAANLSQNLPRDPEVSENLERAGDWQPARRELLKQIVRPAEGTVTVSNNETLSGDGELKVETWQVRLGETWTIPAVGFTRLDAREGTALVIHDEGRAKSGPIIEELLARGFRVVAIDPFYFGEAQVAERAYLWGLMVGTVGSRPLGIQAGQVMAVARSLGESNGGPVSLVAVGPRSSTIALVAAALEPEGIGNLELHRPLGSLKSVIEEGRVYTESPELFCFGLLQDFDIRQLAALSFPRKIVLVEPDQAARTAFDGLTK